MNRVQEFLEESARRYPDKTAISFKQQNLNFTELDQKANQLAHWMRAQGLQRGDRVAIYLPNGFECVIAIWATLKADAVFVLINPGTKGERLSYLLQNSGARLMISTATQLKESADIWQNATELLSALCFPEAPALAYLARDNAPRLAMAGEINDFPKTPAHSVNLDIDLAALVYTSGSTGRPKGVMLSHRNMLCAAASIITYLDLKAEDVLLNVLPLSFDYGLYQMLMAVKLGATLVLEASFAFPSQILQLMTEQKVTVLPIVPTMSALLLAMDLSRFPLPDLRIITNTGAALPIKHIESLRCVWPNMTLFSMYGLTECKRVCYLPPVDLDRKPGSVGLAIPNSEIFVLNAAGEVAAPGEEGELVVRGAHVMQGYWRDPELSAKRLRAGILPGERWLYTGDIFRRDADGYLYFIGRSDDMIKSRGEKVSPREIEELLFRAPGVTGAAVIGVADPLLGHAAIAFVSCKEEKQASTRELLKFLKSELEDYKIPKQIIILPNLPRTENSKIDKLALKQFYGDMQNAQAASMASL